ncbi:hypothetical protein AVEN_8691-1 [Araneus ventricosus]|uniref:Uncharacterized protein n=1 Tax=Araneus ventricosus TaxID=182803 RepID=A0A4Y2C2W8_ARAVE|nr:hypothetical protein AVEN_8691-1 [Araneus ventricosus]
MGGSQSGGSSSTRGSKQQVVCFGASVNDLLNPMNLNRFETNLSLDQMEWIGLLISSYLYKFSIGFKI